MKIFLLKNEKHYHYLKNENQINMYNLLISNFYFQFFINQNLIYNYYNHINFLYFKLNDFISSIIFYKICIFGKKIKNKKKTL